MKKEFKKGGTVMSKFNTIAKNDDLFTVNNCGWTAYSMDDKSKLVTQVLTSFFNESKFYGDNSEDLVETLKRVIEKDPGFVSNLAIFARKEFNMRSVSHVLAGYLAHEPSGKPYVRRTLKNIILRGDDATEILAFYLNTFGKPIPNSLRKGLRDIFPTFDAYTLAKYKGSGKDVKMRDILCLCHPAPRDDKQAETWKQLLEGTIPAAYTWESELSAKGNKKQTWEELIDSGKVGYMALLRNLRNILEASPDNLEKVLERIADPEEVRKSRQLPFRYLSAYRNIPNENRYTADAAREALEKATDAAVENLPKILGKTVIAIDVSGSMCQRISRYSEVTCSDISMLLGFIANRICEKSAVMLFDHHIRDINLPKRNGILHSVMQYSLPGGGTNMSLPFLEMINYDIDCDRIIILSDNECNASLYYTSDYVIQKYADDYRKKSGKDIWVHAVDLCGYGTQQFAGKHTNVIAGWSEKIFEFITLVEQGMDTLIKKIKNYGGVSQ